MDNNWNIKINNGSKYDLDRSGLLQIRDMTESDNGTEYRCTLKTDHGEESIHITFTFVSEEGKNKIVHRLMGSNQGENAFPRVIYRMSFN